MLRAAQPEEDSLHSWPCEPGHCLPPAAAALLAAVPPRSVGPELLRPGASKKNLRQLNLPSGPRLLLCATSKMPTSDGVEQISATWWSG